VRCHQSSNFHLQPVAARYSDLLPRFLLRAALFDGPESGTIPVTLSNMLSVSIVYCSSPTCCPWPIHREKRVEGGVDLVPFVTGKQTGTPMKHSFGVRVAGPDCGTAIGSSFVWAVEKGPAKRSGNSMTSRRISLKKRISLNQNPNHIPVISSERGN
jgi:hypothetical protein